MKNIFGYNFAESWKEISPRLAGLDKVVNLNVKMFVELDVERGAVVDSDCSPIQVQSFMIRVAVALSYCNVICTRLASMAVQAQENLDKVRAQKSAMLMGTAKSDAALERMLGIDPDVSSLKWEAADYEVAQGYADRTFDTLKKDAENWRARFYGAHQDRKLTPGLNDPGPEGSGQGGVPPRIGG